MYEVKDTIAEFKTHYTTNKQLAEEVARDLKKRYSGLSVDIKSCTNQVFHDPGGSLVLGEKPYKFILGKNTISVFPQHFEEFVQRINKKCLERGTDTKYHKIHGYIWCIVITPKEMVSLRKQAKNPELAVGAREIVLKKEAVMDKLVGESNWVRGYKPENKGHLN